MLAVQGPKAPEVLVTVLPGAADVAGLDYMAFADIPRSAAQRDGTAGIRVCRTGYTGERGYELLVPADDAGRVWDALLAAAGRAGRLACGLAARDTLRTEMGYPLHGQDLGGHHAGAGRGGVGGRLVEARVLGPRRAARREGARARAGGCGGCARPGAASRGPGWRCSTGGDQVGTTTSGTFSPTLRTGIALALLDTAAGVGLGAERRRRRPRPAAAVRGRRPPFVPVPRALTRGPPPVRPSAAI